MKRKGYIQSTTKQDIKKPAFAFSFINAGNSLYTALPKETVTASNGMIQWGKGNKFPHYLIDRITECPTLNTVINGCVDYIMGDGIEIHSMPKGYNPKKLNQDGDDFEDIIRKTAYDLVSFGGFANQQIYNDFGELAELSYTLVDRCRLSSDKTTIFYSPSRWTYSTNNYERYPAFGKGGQDKKTEIYFYSGRNPRTHYPVSVYYSAMTAIETEIEIQKFHFNTIINNFNSNAIINFNNGIPETIEKEAIEKGIQDKYTGTENAGVPFIAWNEDKNHAVTVARLNSDDFDTKYQALYKTTRQNIFSAFRAIPALFGVMTESTGFNEQEFSEAFKLFNKTLIAPWQRETVRVFDDILGVKNSFSFKPFNIKFDE